MNCDCKPPQLAVLRTVNKAGQNQGKEFFCCPSSNCKFFQWVDQNGPPSLINRSFHQPTSMGHKQPQPKASIVATIEIKSFDFSERPVKIWMKIFFPYCPELNDLFQSKPREMCYYDNQFKMWIFDFTYYETIVSSILALQLNSFLLKELPKFLQVGLKNYLVSINRVPFVHEDDLEIVQELKDTLLPFQLEGVKFVVARGGKALIGDEMGCGKTVQAIALLQHYRKHWPALILMPVSLVEQWKGELLNYSGDILKESDICVIRKGSDKIHGHIVLVPYSLIEKLVEGNKISPDQFGMVVADESHNIKSGDAKRTASVLPFLKRAPVSLCLTGTPAVNRPVELYTQLNGLLPSVFYNYDQFVERYCDAKPQRFNANIMDVKGSSNEMELKTLLEGMVMIRRLKDDVVKSLPVKQRELRYVDPDPTYAKQISQIQKRQTLLDAKLKDFTLDDGERSKISFEQKQLLLRFYQITGVSKLKAIKQELFHRINEARLQRGIDAAADSLVDNNEKELLSAEYADSDVVNSKIGSRDQPIVLELEPDIIMGLEENDQLDYNEAKKQLEEDDVIVDTDDESTGIKKKGKKRGRDAKATKMEMMFGDSEDEEAVFDDDVIDLCETPTIDNFFAPKNKPLKKSTKQKSSKTSSTTSDEEYLPAIETHGKKTITEEFSGKAVGQKILVFAHHHDVLDGIEDCLREAQVGFIRVDGKTSKPQKALLIKKFQTCPTMDVALLSITACGTGLNLTTANIAIFAELYWSPGVVLQAEDRIHRIGQKSKEVKLIYLLARNTADDVVWDQIQRKYSVLGATIGNADGVHHFSNATVTSTKNGKEAQHGNSGHQRRMDDFATSSSTVSAPQPLTHVAPIELKPYERAAADAMTIAIPNTGKSALEHSPDNQIPIQSNSLFNTNNDSWNKGGVQLPQVDFSSSIPHVPLVAAHGNGNHSIPGYYSAPNATHHDQPFSLVVCNHDNGQQGLSVPQINHPTMHNSTVLPEHKFLHQVANQGPSSSFPMHAAQNMVPSNASRQVPANPKCPNPPRPLASSNYQQPQHQPLSANPASLHQHTTWNSDNKTSCAQGYDPNNQSYKPSIYNGVQASAAAAGYHHDERRESSHIPPYQQNAHMYNQTWTAPQHSVHIASGPSGGFVQSSVGNSHHNPSHASTTTQKANGNNNIHMSTSASTNKFAEELMDYYTPPVNMQRENVPISSNFSNSYSHHDIHIQQQPPMRSSISNLQVTAIPSQQFPFTNGSKVAPSQHPTTNNIPRLHSSQGSSSSASSSQPDVPPVITSCVKDLNVFGQGDVSWLTINQSNGTITRQPQTFIPPARHVPMQDIPAKHHHTMVTSIHQSHSSSASLPQPVQNVPPLTPEMIAKIERNKQEALRKRALADQNKTSVQGMIPSPNLAAPQMKTANGSAVTLNPNAVNFANRMFST